MKNKFFLAQTLFWVAAVALASADGAGNSSGPLMISVGNDPRQELAFWLQTSLKRVFPGSPPGSTNLNLLTARNGTWAFQACLRNEGTTALNVECSVRGVKDLESQVRSVGLVPMPHFTPNTPTNELAGIGFLPGLDPDPLYPEPELRVGPQESRSFWITLGVPTNAQPGTRELGVRFSIGGKQSAVELPVKLEISPFVIEPRHGFHVIHWWRGEATWDYYKTGMFDKRWWEITKAQLQDMLAHGSDVVYVPMFFDRREVFKHPCQMLIVNEPEPGVYTFDWSIVKEFTDMCKQLGFANFEWSHMWIYWGVKHPMRIYKKVGDKYVLLWSPDIGGFSDTYLHFLKQFLPSFHHFLVQQGLLDHSYFHLSDEPGGGQAVTNYKHAREILRNLAPWMKVMDALSDIEYGKQHLTDMPVVMDSAAQAYIDAGIPHWVYFCCSPQGPWLNRFLDTPLPKIRMSGWLFYRLGAKGFLHWGFNYWDKMASEVAGDPFHDASNEDWPGIPYGDPFMIYPGPDGKPIDSIRWEVFSESLQDYAILRTAGVKPDGKLLSDIHTYADFPKNERWIDEALRTILQAPYAGIKKSSAVTALSK